MKRLFVVTMAVIVSASLLCLSCSAAWNDTVTAADWWNFQTSTCSLYCYSSSGAWLSTASPVNPAGFVSRQYDISPYVSWSSVTSRYISSLYAGLEYTFIPLPSGASMYGIQLQFTDGWTLLKGRTYEFVILRNYIAFYNSSGTAVSTGTQLSSVSLGGLAMTLEDKYIGTGGFDRAIRCTVTPTADTFVQTISVSFKSNYNPTTAASKIVLNLGFSDVISYTGSLDSVVVNPSLDRIDKQVSEIQGSVDDIKGIMTDDYGVITGSHPDNPADQLPEDDAVNSANGIIDRVELFLKGIPADVPVFWRNVVEFLFGLPIFLPFITVSVGFILSRMIMGR